MPGDIRKLISRLYSLAISVPIFVKIFGICVLLTVFIGVNMLFQTRAIMQVAMYKDLERLTYSEAQSMSARLSQSVATNNLVAIQRALTQASERLPDLRYIIVRGIETDILAHTFEGAVPLDLLQSPSSSETADGSFRVLETNEGMIFEATSPILGGHGGILQLGMLDYQVQSEVTAVTKSIIWVFIISVAISFALAHVLTYFLTYPITHLEKVSKQIKDGDFTARSEVFASDEIGHLAVSFNEMAANLQRYRQEVEEKEAARIALIQKTVNVQEEERKLLSRELHDQLGQSVLALLCTIQAECEVGDHNCTVYNEMETKLRELVDDIRRMAWGMRPSILDDYGLEHALNRYIESTVKHSTVDFKYQYSSSSETGRLPGIIEITLYRITQEAITNIIRHSDAKHASVVVLQGLNDVALLVEDDGMGFDGGSVQIDTQLGLTGIKERATLLGGTCDIESSPGTGTTIRVKIPLNGAITCQ